MSRKSAYKQVLSIGTAVVLGFALFTGSLDGAPKLLSPQSNEQAAALAEKQNESPSRTGNEADLVARLESGTASSEDSGDGSESAAPDTGDAASEDSSTTPIDEVENPDLNRARGVYLSSIPDYAGNPYVALRADSTHPLGTPSFTLDEYERATEEGCFKKFSKLDSLGRTRKALACVGPRVARTGKTRRYLAHPSCRLAPAALRLYSGPEPLQSLPPYRLVALRRKRQPQKSPHRHALSQRDGHATV